MNNCRTSIIRYQIPKFAYVSNMKMCVSTYNSNIIIKVEKLVEYDSQISHL